MSCKHFRRRTKKGVIYFYCALHRKNITYDDCKNCDDKEYRVHKGFKKPSYKKIKKEKERFSIIYTDFDKCCSCGLKKGQFDGRINLPTRIDKNEVFEGSYRQRSIDDGMVCPLCVYCHNKFHTDRLFNLKYKVMFQKEYLKNHTLEEFIKKYGKNYEETLILFKKNQ
jgi:hypothetical protein